MKLKERQGNLFVWLLKTGYRPFVDESVSDFLPAVRKLAGMVDAEWNNQDIQHLIKNGFTITFCRRYSRNFRDFYCIRDKEYTYSDTNWKELHSEKLQYILSQWQELELSSCHDRSGRILF